MPARSNPAAEPLAAVLRNLRLRLARVTRDARRAIVATPVEVTLAIAMAVALSIAVERDDEEHFRRTAEAILTGLLALGVAFAASSLRHLNAVGPRLRWALTAGGLASVAAYGCWVLDTRHAVELWRWAFLAVGVPFAVALVPLAARGANVDRRVLLWRFNIRVVDRTIFVGLYTAVMYVGLALALGAVDALFQIDLPGEVYAHLAIALFVGVGLWLVVAGLPAFVDAGSPLSELTVTRAALAARWAIVPLLVVYSLILCAYAVRVAVLVELPANIVSPMTLGAAVLALAATFVLDPLHARTDHPWLAAAIRWLPVVYLPLVALALWALWLRIDQHGWTEFRYARWVALVGVILCLVGGTVRLAQGRPPPIVGYLGVFAAAALLSAFGPWGAAAVSKRSQLQRLEGELTALGVLTDDGRLDRDLLGQGGVESAALGSPASRVTYLVDHHGWEAIAPLVPSSIGPERPRDGRDAAGVLGLIPWHHSDPRRRVYLEAMGPHPVGSAGHLVRLQWPHHGDMDPLGVEIEGAVVRLKVGPGGRGRADLEPLVRRSSPDQSQAEPSPTVGVPAADMQLPLQDAQGHTQGHLLLESVQARVGDVGVEVLRVQGLVHIPHAAATAGE